MKWYNRSRPSFVTPSTSKLNLPENYWYKTDKGEFIDRNYLEKHAFVSPSGYHFRLHPQQYFELIFDQAQYKIIFEDIVAEDVLGFVDTQPYPARLRSAQQHTRQLDAMQVAAGKVGGHALVVAAMDFRFIAGSMGMVVGEKICQAVEYCLKERAGLMIISQSGGARMMEAAFSLMQMARTSMQLGRLAQAKLPYISYLTHPTTGGVSASFAMLGDLNLSEPAALIAFAGPRVVQQTIGQALPEGFQTAEFLLEHGFIDKIIDRRVLGQTLVDILGFFSK